MLTLEFGSEEYWNEEINEFVYSETIKINMEHSLISVSKWEDHYHKPFFSKTERTIEETIYYIKCMTLNEVDDGIYDKLKKSDIKIINSYIEDSHTATWFREVPGSSQHRGSSEQITSELIYYWMVSNQIPFDCERWNINRLLTLIRICNVKNNPGKKMGKRDILSSNAALNAARRKQLGTSG